MRPVTVLGAALALLAVGCTVQPPTATPDDRATDATDATAPPVAASTVPEASPPGATVPTAADPEVPAWMRTAPLARVDHPLTDLDGVLEAELRAERVGDLLRVAVTFTPRQIPDGSTTLASLLGGTGMYEGISARLIDPVHLLEYGTVRPTVPHGQAVPAHVDHPSTLVFYFGAPVEPLETFDLLLDLEATAVEWPGFVDVPFEGA